MSRFLNGPHRHCDSDWHCNCRSFASGCVQFCVCAVCCSHTQMRCAQRLTGAGREWIEIGPQIPLSFLFSSGRCQHTHTRGGIPRGCVGPSAHPSQPRVPVPALVPALALAPAPVPGSPRVPVPGPGPLPAPGLRGTRAPVLRHPLKPARSGRASTS